MAVKSLKRILEQWGGYSDNISEAGVLDDLANNLPFGVKTEKVEIVPQQSVTLNDGFVALTLDIAIEVGKKYTVMFNDVKYECVGIDMTSMNGFTAYGLIDNNDTEQPSLFMIAYIPESNKAQLYGGNILMEVMETDITTVKFSITTEQEVVKPLDTKFSSFDLVIFKFVNADLICNKTYDECKKLIAGHNLVANFVNQINYRDVVLSSLSMGDEGDDGLFFSFIHPVSGIKTLIIYMPDGTVDMRDI